MGGKKRPRTGRLVGLGSGREELSQRGAPIHQHRGGSGGAWPALTGKPELITVSGLLGLTMALSLSTEHMGKGPLPRAQPQPP